MVFRVFTYSSFGLLSEGGSTDLCKTVLTLSRHRGFHEDKSLLWEYVPSLHARNQPCLTWLPKTMLCHFFFLFLVTLRHMEFLGQGSDPSHSQDLSCSCSNDRSLTHCARLGIEPASQRSQDAADPVVPQQELQKSSMLSEWFSNQTLDSHRNARFYLQVLPLNLKQSPLLSTWQVNLKLSWNHSIFANCLFRTLCSQT